MNYIDKANSQILKYLNIESDSFLDFLKEFSPEVCLPTIVENKNGLVATMYVTFYIKCEFTSEDVLVFLKLHHQEDCNRLNLSVAWFPMQEIIKASLWAYIPISVVYREILNQIKTSSSGLTYPISSQKIETLMGFFSLKQIALPSIRLTNFVRVDFDDHDIWYNRVKEQLVEYFAY